MLPKKNRLITRGDFTDVFRGTLRARSGPFQLICRKNDLLGTRFGFVVSLIVSKKAVRRNKLRRQLHEIARHVLPACMGGYDCVIRAYPGADELRFEEVKRHTHILLQKVGIEKLN